MCEDYPCCGHTPADPCTREWYDEPGAFDLTRDPHAFCEHEHGICESDEWPDEDEDDPEFCEHADLDYFSDDKGECARCGTVVPHLWDIGY